MHALLVDVAMLVLANALFLPGGAGYSLPLLIAFDVVVVGLVAGSHGYAKRLRLQALDDLRLTFTSTAVATMTILAIDALQSADEPGVYPALRLWLLATVLLAVGRLSSNLVVAWRRASSRTAATTIIVGAGRVGRLTAIRLLDHPEFGLRPIGFLDAEPMEISGRPLSLPVLGTAEISRASSPRTVSSAQWSPSRRTRTTTCWTCSTSASASASARSSSRASSNACPRASKVTHVGGLPLLELLPTSPHSIQFAIKYAIDRLAALALLVLLSPLLLVLTVAVALSLGRPILYRQDRVSLDGRRFNMLKFRTMVHAPDADAAGRALRSGGRAGRCRGRGSQDAGRNVPAASGRSTSCLSSRTSSGAR